MVSLCKDLWEYIVPMKNWPYGKDGSQALIPLLQLKGRNQHLVRNSQFLVLQGIPSKQQPLP